jgi:conjugal transfer pilin signal peptidase TrbI
VRYATRTPLGPVRSALRAVLAYTFGAAVLGAICAGHGRSFVSLAYDPHEQHCLPELHLALLVHMKPTTVARGDYLFWHASTVPALSYVTEQFALKRVAGIPGDRLSIRGEQVFINGQLVAEGLEDAVLYQRHPSSFERTEVIPAGRYFVIGTARLSNDSRYWGYLRHDAIAGTGYRIY